MPSFVPDLPVILAFALASIVLAITPGPDMALQLSRTVNYGRGHGLATAAGAMSGVAVHTTLVALGISVLIVAAPTLFLGANIAGAVYLLWLAYQAIVHGGGLKIAAKAKRTPTLRESYATGVGINLLNPKVVLFFVTFLPQFVDRHDVDAPAKLFFLGAEFIAVSIPLGLLTVVAAEQVAQAPHPQQMGAAGAQLEFCRGVHGVCRRDPYRAGAALTSCRLRGAPSPTLPTRGRAFRLSSLPGRRLSTGTVLHPPPFGEGWGGGRPKPPPRHELPPRLPCRRFCRCGQAHHPGAADRVSEAQADRLPGHRYACRASAATTLPASKPALARMARRH